MMVQLILMILSVFEYAKNAAISGKTCAQTQCAQQSACTCCRRTGRIEIPSATDAPCLSVSAHLITPHIGSDIISRCGVCVHKQHTAAHAIALFYNHCVCVW